MGYIDCPIIVDNFYSVNIRTPQQNGVPYYVVHSLGCRGRLIKTTFQGELYRSRQVVLSTLMFLDRYQTTDCFYICGSCVCTASG